MLSPCKDCDDVLKFENQTDRISVKHFRQLPISQTEIFRLKKSVANIVSVTMSLIT